MSDSENFLNLPAFQIIVRLELFVPELNACDHVVNWMKPESVVDFKFCLLMIGSGVSYKVEPFVKVVVLVL